MCNFALRKNGLKHFYSDEVLCDKIVSLETRCSDEGNDFSAVLHHLKTLVCRRKRGGK